MEQIQDYIDSITELLVESGYKFKIYTKTYRNTIYITVKIHKIAFGQFVWRKASAIESEWSRLTAIDDFCRIEQLLREVI